MQEHRRSQDESFEAQAERYHHSLPGFIRATLVDHGIAPAVVDRYRLGWDGLRVTVPVRMPGGRIAFFERWDLSRALRTEPLEAVELFGWARLESPPHRVFFAEGVREALVLESAGVAAVAATGSGRFFRERAWGPALRRVPELVLAFKRGQSRERQKHLPTRAQVIDRMLRALPNARVLTWPPGAPREGGAFDFFAVPGHSAADLERRLP